MSDVNSGTGDSFDPMPILRVLDDHGVDYIVIGGVAARAHGARRITFDLDVVTERSRQNLQRLATALIELGARLRVANLAEDLDLPHLNADLLAGWRNVTWSTRYGPFDVLGDVPGPGRQRYDYDRLSTNAVRTIHTDPDGRLAVWVAGLDDLVDSKRTVGRPKDLEALSELEQLRRRRRR